MNQTDEVCRRRAVAQALANAHLEGFEVDEEYLALLDRYILGQITIAQVIAETDRKFATRGEGSDPD